MTNINPKIAIAALTLNLALISLGAGLSQAEEVLPCYMIDESGVITDLEDLCSQSSGTDAREVKKPEPEPSAETTPPRETRIITTEGERTVEEEETPESEPRPFEGDLRGLRRNQDLVEQE
ncbi:hypothetical protein [Gloeocapsa sp. PCC 73106]|uniref:hypothetical protein n=1 Tax=Gloeocapsa sp. PCC 73106 TaxID=102232 RepID=UPI0005557135|nr:hypothetical protein [Gloeocapsa sp. PCC 73106]